MTIDIQSMIEQRPHLKDPLEFYARCQRYQREAAELLPKQEAALSPDDSKAYPKESAGDILGLFASIFDLTDEELAPLGLALENGEIDFMRLPLNEVPDLSLPYGKDVQASILFLLSRPYFFSLRKGYPLDGGQWEDGRCPLCSAKPALSTISQGPERQLHCSCCGTIGSYVSRGCPNCGTEDATKLGTLEADEEQGFQVATCEDCRTYVKVVEGSLFKEMTADLTDMVSLPLDIVAQEKGYVRRVPNPIGLKKML